MLQTLEKNTCDLTPLREVMQLLICQLLMATLIIVPTFTQTNLAEKAAISFTLKDQYNVETIMRFPTGYDMLLVFSGRGNTKQVPEWIRQLKKDIPDSLTIMYIATTGWVPFFMKSAVKSSFFNRPSILIDWGNNVADQYGYSTERCLLVYVSKAGTIKSVAEGEFGNEKYQLFINVLRNQSNN
jgi:hypothetical protein